MSAEFVRRVYGVPAKRGGRVAFTLQGVRKVGTITSFPGARIRVRIDGERHPIYLHPTAAIEYLRGDA